MGSSIRSRFNPAVARMTSSSSTFSDSYYRQIENVDPGAPAGKRNFVAKLVAQFNTAKHSKARRLGRSNSICAAWLRQRRSNWIRFTGDDCELRCKQVRFVGVSCRSLGKDLFRDY